MSSRTVLLIVALSIIAVVALLSSRDSTTSSASQSVVTTTSETPQEQSPTEIKIFETVKEKLPKQKQQEEESNEQQQQIIPAGKIFSKQFLNSDDAAGQIWEFPSSSDFVVRDSPKSFQQIKQEYTSCKGQVNYSGIPDFQEIFKAAETTPFWKASEDDIDLICKKRGTTRITAPDQIPFLIYGALFGFEVNILEIALHEAVPIVDAFVVSESTITHAKHSKPVVFRNLIKSHRFKRFADLVQPEGENEEGEPKKTGKKYKIFPRVFSSKKEKSGWDVERKQRREFQRSIPTIMKYLVNTHAVGNDEKIVPERPVIVISQLDLDEIPSRETLLYWKHCQEPHLPLRVLWFRYQLECQQELAHSRFYSTIWKVKKISGKFDPGLDLYSRRRAVSPVKVTHDVLPQTICDTTLFLSDAKIAKDNLDPAVAWHFSAFGGLLAVRRKNKHSPHSFVRREIIREEEIRGCIFNNKERTKLPPGWWVCDNDGGAKKSEKRTKVMPVALPHFIAENICMFVRGGWMS
jgi:hypothetical protein